MFAFRDSAMNGSHPASGYDAEMFENAVDLMNKPIPLLLRGIGDAVAADTLLASHQQFTTEPMRLQLQCKIIRSAAFMLELGFGKRIVFKKKPVQSVHGRFFHPGIQMALQSLVVSGPQFVDYILFHHSTAQFYEENNVANGFVFRKIAANASTAGSGAGKRDGEESGAGRRKDSAPGSAEFNGPGA
jgi:hypothetical protein